MTDYSKYLNAHRDPWKTGPVAAETDELRAEIDRLRAALREIETQDIVEISLDPDWPHLTALHRSFPEAGDGRPLPPMGDELMTAGLCPDDARFVAVQLAQNGYQLVQAAEIERLRAALDDMLYWVDELSQQVEASDPAAFREDYNTAAALIDKETGK